MSFRNSSSNWQWRYFAAPDIPDVLAEQNGFIENELALPDGRTLQAVPFEFPAEGIINMYDIMPEIPAALARNLLIADFTADAPGSLFIGLAADWKWTFRFNGQVLVDIPAKTADNRTVPKLIENEANQHAEDET